MASLQGLDIHRAVVHRADCICPDMGVDWARAWVQHLDEGIGEDSNCMDCGSLTNTSSDAHLWEVYEAGDPGGGSCAVGEEDMGSCSVDLALGYAHHTYVVEAAMGGSRSMVLGHCALDVGVCMENVGSSLAEELTTATIHEPQMNTLNSK